MRGSLRECRLSEPPRRIAALPALRHERAGVGRHRRAAFVDDADDAERRRNALDREAVRALESRQHAPDGIGQGGDLLDAFRHRLDARVVEVEAVEKGAGDALGFRGGKIVAVGGADRLGIGADRGGGGAQRMIFGFGRGERERMRGGARLAPEPRHQGGDIFCAILRAGLDAL